MSFAIALFAIVHSFRFGSGTGYRGRIVASEYLGTTQIVTLDAAHGPVKARIGSEIVVKIGDTTGMRFDPRSITMFDAANGKALISKANQRVLNHG